MDPTVAEIGESIAWWPDGMPPSANNVCRRAWPPTTRPITRRRDAGRPSATDPTADVRATRATIAVPDGRTPPPATWATAASATVTTPSTPPRATRARRVTVGGRDTLGCYSTARSPPLTLTDPTRSLDGRWPPRQPVDIRAARRLGDPTIGPQRDPQVAHRVTTARVAATSWNPASSEMRAAAPGGTPTSNVTPQERHVA